MAENSGSVGIVAIIAILILVVGAFYYFNGGSFQLNKEKSTVVNETTVVNPPETPKSE